MFWQMCDNLFSDILNYMKKIPKIDNIRDINGWSLVKYGENYLRIKKKKN